MLQTALLLLTLASSITADTINNHKNLFVLNAVVKPGYTLQQNQTLVFTQSGYLTIGDSELTQPMPVPGPPFFNLTRNRLYVQDIGRTYQQVVYFDETDTNQVSALIPSGADLRVPHGHTHSGFQIIDNKLSFNGTSEFCSFYTGWDFDGLSVLYVPKGQPLPTVPQLCIPMTLQVNECLNWTFDAALDYVPHSHCQK